MLGSEVEVLSDGGDGEGIDGVGDVNVGRHRRDHLQPPNRLGRTHILIASTPFHYSTVLDACVMGGR